jgi:hypothetical protein
MGQGLRQSAEVGDEPQTATARANAASRHGFAGGFNNGNVISLAATSPIETAEVSTKATPTGASIVSPSLLKSSTMNRASTPAAAKQASDTSLS